MKSKNHNKNLIKEHELLAARYLRMFELWDNIAYPFSADNLYDKYLFHLNTIKELKKIS